MLLLLSGGLVVWFLRKRGDDVENDDANTSTSSNASNGGASMHEKGPFHVKHSCHGRLALKEGSVLKEDPSQWCGSWTRQQRQMALRRAIVTLKLAQQTTYTNKKLYLYVSTNPRVLSINYYHYGSN